MAAASIYCCLNVCPPNSSPAPSLCKPTLSSWPVMAAATGKEASWRSRCVSTAACVILGSAVGLAEVNAGGDSFAHAEGVHEAAAGSAVESRAVRWSDVRECPPWRANSLENIVPENLPRPSARRRLEMVRINRSAPAVAPGSIGAGRRGCYSL